MFSFPRELQWVVLCHLNPKWLAVCRRVCRAWRDAVDSDVCLRSVGSVEEAVTMLMFNGLAAQHNPSIVALVSQLPRTQHQRCQTAAIKISADNNETILAITRDASLVLTQKKVGWQTHRQCELIPAAKYATAAVWPSACVQMMRTTSATSSRYRHVTRYIIAHFLLPKVELHHMNGYEGIVTELADMYDRSQMFSMLANIEVCLGGIVYAMTASTVLHTSRFIAGLKIAPAADVDCQSIISAFSGLVHKAGGAVRQCFKLIPHLCLTLDCDGVSVFSTRRQDNLFLLVVVQPDGAPPYTAWQLQAIFDAQFSPEHGRFPALAATFTHHFTVEQIRVMATTVRHKHGRGS